MKQVFGLASELCGFEFMRAGAAKHENRSDDCSNDDSERHIDPCQCLNVVCGPAKIIMSALFDNANAMATTWPAAAPAMPPSNIRTARGNFPSSHPM